MKLSRTVGQVFFIVTLICVLGSAAKANPTSAPSQSQSIDESELFIVHLPVVVLEQDNSSEFERLSQELAAMQEFFSGGNDQPIPEEQPPLPNTSSIAAMEEQIAPVTFDEQAARQQGFSAESIKLAQQLAAFTNDLVAGSVQAQQAGKTASVEALDVNIAAYPELTAYFDAATSYELPNDVTGEDPEVSTQYWLQQYVCGAFWRPLPSQGQMDTGAQYRYFHNMQDPSGTLYSWGYWKSRPGSLAGGGWTRVQNHWPLICGWFAFRDHAYIYNGNTIQEQNYEGWSPRGEPNPEVYYVRWPYPWWPSYVWWWHICGPGEPRESRPWYCR